MVIDSQSPETNQSRKGYSAGRWLAWIGENRTLDQKEIAGGFFSQLLACNSRTREDWIQVKQLGL
jgi:hypothetical protein